MSYWGIHAGQVKGP